MLWQPTATWQTWKQRQDLVHRIRSFFVQKNVVEVDVPVLASASGTDPHLDYFQTDFFVDGAQREDEDRVASAHQERYLVTSPEFYLKRCLAAGFGDLYYLGKAFRNGEAGPRHNPEFTILEWYRLGWSLEQLMEEVAGLVQELSGNKMEFRVIRWRDAFVTYLKFDPFNSELGDWMGAAERAHVPVLDNGTREEWLDYLLVSCIEPVLGKKGLEFMVDYPPEQAALAQIKVGEDGLPWACRFELYWQGVELCNGYQELQAPQEQRTRFEKDLQIRQQLNKRIPRLDERFLAALDASLPACSGVAVGVDRLLMLLLGKTELAEVILFPESRN